MSKLFSKVPLVMLFALCFPAVALMPGAQATNFRWQCVTFARSFSGIEIRGNAHTWWEQSAGRYHRSSRPEVGAVLVFKSFGTGGMRLGHVATISEVLNNREVLITHANWTGKGEVDTNVRAVDVSPSGDWSRVRVWYPPVNDLGRTAYPAFGFIHPNYEG
jgi:surface antigen